MKTVILHGALADSYGGPFTLDIHTPLEAFRALGANLPGFWPAVRDGAYQIIAGDMDTGMEVDSELLGLGLGRCNELHIVPALAGGGRGAGKVILGVALIAAAWWAAPAIMTGGTAAMVGGEATMVGVTTATSWGSTALLGISYGQIAVMGGMMALGGVSQMLAPTPKVAQARDRNESFLFNGPGNVSTQGGAVPLVYGEFITDSTVVSQGIDSESIRTFDSDIVLPGDGWNGYDAR